MVVGQETQTTAFKFENGEIGKFENVALRIGRFVSRGLGMEERRLTRIMDRY